MSMPGLVFVNESTHPSLESDFMITFAKLAEFRANTTKVNPPRESVKLDGSKSSPPSLVSLGVNISSLS